MRFVISLLLVAVVLQSAIAVTSRANQAKIMIEKINTKLQKTHLGRALKNMVSLATKLGYNYDDLFDAFDTLKDSLLNRKQDEEDLYGLQTSVHESNVQSLESDITRFTNDIAAHEAQLSAEQNDLATQEQNLADHQASLATDQANRQSAVESLAALEAFYASEVEQFTQARELISLAVAHLQAAQENYNNAGFAFVQVSNKATAFATKLTATTSKLSAKHQLFIKPVVQVLSQLKSSQSSIQTAIDALLSLQAYFDNALADGTNIYLNFKGYYEATIANLTQSIDTYVNSVIPEDENQIANSKVAIQQTEENLVVDHSNLDTANATLVEENAAWERTTERHNALIDRLNNEYDLVVSAERIIRNAQENLEA